MEVVLAMMLKGVFTRMTRSEEEENWRKQVEEKEKEEIWKKQPEKKGKDKNMVERVLVEEAGVGVVALWVEVTNVGLLRKSLLLSSYIPISICMRQSNKSYK